MLSELPWQLWVIIGELWVSALIGSVILNKTYRYSWKGIGWVFSDVVMIALLVWGGNPSWQHFIIGALYGWAVINRIRKTIEGRVHVHDKEAPEGLTTFFLCLLSTVFTLLVVTG